MATAAAVDDVSIFQLREDNATNGHHNTPLLRETIRTVGDYAIKACLRRADRYRLEWC